MWSWTWAQYVAPVVDPGLILSTQQVCGVGEGVRDVPWAATGQNLLLWGSPSFPFSPTKPRKRIELCSELHPSMICDSKIGFCCGSLLAAHAIS